MTASPSAFTLTEVQRQRLRRALDREGHSYNPAERLLRVPFSSPGYHTTLKGGWVHPTRESFIYAVALLDSGERDERDRALGILDRLLALQDTDPASTTYGIWSWFMDESLEQMAPPDWNWADFCGAQLLEIALTHGPFLPLDLQARIRESILHAARSIERRDVGPHYTNIAIMGSFVTLMAAENYEVPDLRTYAMAKLRLFHAFTREQGGFAEYNSPTYTVVALDELGRLLRFARDPEARVMIEELYRTAWKEIANHFHAPTRQWAGPQSRAYQTLLSPHVYGLLHRATDGRFLGDDVEPVLNEHRLVHVCPPDLEPSFLSLEKPREVRQTFIQGKDGCPGIIGTTYLAPEFTLGSVNVGDLWNQRRALLAYWGAPEAASSLRLRFLHDGADFSGAYLLSVQRGGDLLGGIGFALDGYDTHPFFDKIKDGAIRARDLRLRFEIEGPAASRLPSAPTNLRDPWMFDDGDFHLAVTVAHAVWGDAEGCWEMGGGEGKSWLDVVLYAGPEQKFDLAEMSGAACALAVRCAAESVEPFAPEVACKDGRLVITADGLEVTCASVPLSTEKLLGSFSTSQSPSLLAGHLHSSAAMETSAKVAI